MKKFILFFICTLFSFTFSKGFSQATSEKKLNDIAQVNSNGKFLLFNKKDIKPEEVFTTYKEYFGLGADDNMAVLKSEVDGLGITTTRYQQQYKGVNIEGAVYLVHSKNGKAYSANGMLIKNLSVSSNASVTPAKAIEKAVQFTGAEKFMWENPENEKMIKNITGNQDATFYPKALLVFADPKYSGNSKNYRLAYKINVYTEVPLSNKYYFIDALSGEVFHTLAIMMNTDKKGTALTRYSGTRKITFDSVGVNSYRMREADRGNGIETYNLNNGTNYAVATDFTNNDTLWSISGIDQVCTDAQWGAEMTYDFYKEVHGRNSIDDQGFKLMSYVHYSTNYGNASWDGYRMTYGDGDGATFTGPLTSIDICGHEITHGLTQKTADLIYQDEPGALNEAFSDIFGACIRSRAYHDSTTWLIGDKITASHQGIRNMQNPHQFQQPNTYHGQYWSTDPLDMGGVHTNNGIGNYWFYLLSVGGSGTNDNGVSYNIQGIGLNKADSIAYRTLTQILCPSSQFIDARDGSLAAASDIYGPCSNEYIQCANAWYAVGVGLPVRDYDFSMNKIKSPVTACGLSMVPVEAQIRYNGCNNDVPAGDTIYFFYKFDSNPVVKDTLVLLSPVSGGDTINFTFDDLADASLLGTHTIKCWLHYKYDSIQSDDTIKNYQFQNKLYQNIDVRPIAVVAPVSSCFMGISPITVKIGFYGCDSIPKTDSIPVSYSINNAPPVKEMFHLTQGIMPNQSVNLTFAQQYDFSVPGNYSFKIRTYYPDDTLADTVLNNHVVKNPYQLSDKFITFNGSNVMDSINIRKGSKSKTEIKNLSGIGKVLHNTGANPMDIMDSIQLPNMFNVWQVNGFVSVKADFCIDATAFQDSLFLQYDIKQTFGKSAYEQFLGPDDYSLASSFRILVDNNQIGGTTTPDNSTTFVWKPYVVDLNAYKGTKFVLTMETRTICRDSLIFIMDHAYIDNIGLQHVDPTAVYEIKSDDGNLLIYPNPSNGNFNINLTSEKNQTSKIEVYDIMGKIVKSEEWNVIQGDNNHKVSNTNLADGIYFVKIAFNDKTYNQKIIVKK